MKKRLISLLLVCFMIVAMLVSCGSKTPTQKPSTDDGTTTKPTTSWWSGLNFNNTTLTLRLSDAQDAELPVGGRDYMQGPDMIQDQTNNADFEKVKNEVYLRNKAAEQNLGVRLSYQYSTQVWGSVRGEIVTLENARTGPDMYCDMMYDMVAASLENSPKVFANVLKYTTTDEKGVDGYVGGHFKLGTEAGYYQDLMNDMALSDDKLFLLASDYYLDVLRAMLIMPFNMDMYRNRVNSEDPNAQALYDIATAGNWTWDELMKMNTVYSGPSNLTLESDNMLMVLSHGGLSSAGLLYSTAFENYEEDYVADRVVITLSTSSAVVDRIFRKVAEVVRTAGVLCDATVTGDVAGVQAAKEAFTNGKALFAGPNMLGVIEETAFGNMDQLGILPVPKLDVNAEYNTVINTRARVGAISYNSANKIALSALIQYQTENSEAVRTEYFDKAMNGKYLQGAGASTMLELVYDSIGDNKTMVIDHLLHARNNAAVGQYTLTELLKADYFIGNANNINSTYLAAASAKQTVLDSAIDAWYLCD